MCAGMSAGTACEGGEYMGMPVSIFILLAYEDRVIYDVLAAIEYTNYDYT